MAVISADTFDPTNRYVSVRLQQGVPLVDADWNEMQDATQFALRTFMRWFIGDGIPAGSNGFRIEGSGANNDFTISAGITPPVDMLRNVGRCLVDGREVYIQSDITFTGQALHEDNGQSATDLAAAWQVPVISSLTTPLVDGEVTVYLDVWERLVTPVEDPSLVHTGLGVESCARLRREWAVRVRDGDGTPASGDVDHLAGHSYYALALIARRSGVDAIDPDSVIDTRRRQLTLSHIIEALAPSLAADPFTPDAGAVGQPITIFGNHLGLGNTHRVFFGNIQATPVMVINSNQISVPVPPVPPGAYRIRVETDFGSVRTSNAFVSLGGGIEPPPQLNQANEFDPNAGAAGQQIRLFGNNFDVAGLEVLFRSDAPDVSANIINSTSIQIVAQVPLIIAGAYSIVVRTDGGEAVSSNNFIVF